MIEILNGIHETVCGKESIGFKLHDNTDAEYYPAHWHSEIEIIMPMKSNYEITIDDEDYILEERDIIIINSGVIHTVGTFKKGYRLIIQLDMSMLNIINTLESVLTMMPSALIIRADENSEFHQKVEEKILKISDEYHNSIRLGEAAIYSYLIQIFVLIGRNLSENSELTLTSPTKKKEYAEKFMNICNYINEHCTEDLALDDIAAIAGFSKYHFSRMFKQFTGCSYYKYLNRKRIEVAEKLLIDPQNSITEVSLGCGFTSISAFIRMFKQIKGCTPTEFRKMYNF